MKKQWVPIACVMLLAVFAAGCAGPNPLQGTSGTSGVAGFWAGVWHGLICPISFVVSLFDRHVRIYEVHNSGIRYDLGFLLGASCSIGSAGHGSGRGGRDR